MCGACGKTKHFKEVYIGNNGRTNTVHDIEQKATSDNQITMANINYISFNSKQFVTKEQLAKTKIKSSILKMYNKTKITQLGTCKVKTAHNKKQKHLNSL